MAFAAVGAAELLSVEPGNSAALRLLADYAATVARPKTKSDWPWPEPRLTYANAILPEAMIAAGVALDDPDLKQRGLDLLEWLLDYETIDGHLSPTPVGRPGAAGQPARLRPAADRGGHPRRRLRTRRSRRSAGALAGWDPVVPPPGSRAPTTPGCSCGTRRPVVVSTGCSPTCVNLNQGAESTLAVISTLQHAQRFSLVPQ